MNVEIKIPGVGESITEGTLALWSVADGSVVIEGQAIFELETDKTTIDVTAPATGTISITVAGGTDVVIDQVVGIVDTDKAETTVKDSAPVVEAHSPAPSGGRITPAAKAEATVKGINTATLTGSGRNGMVTRSDVKEDFKEPRQRSTEIRKPLSRIRKIIAANLRKTQSELVLLTTFNEVDMSAIKAMRRQFGEAFREKHGVKLGFMSFFLKASASTLAAYPEINAWIDGNDVVYREGIHISVAVSTPKGLVTPVVRSVENLSFADIERQIIGFSKKAADKKLLPEDLMGGSFTITNGGIFGSMLSTPLPAPGQSAILGMHAVQDRPAAVNGEVVIRPMMYLALSYDHRLVDGREAVGFLKTIKDTLENPERLLLEL
ncbi:MAG: dihydrolipoyllysine-residue succinyltransferase [Spirochaetes bacterium]|nr:MAG: dihydrolipoyllysine-residue succinyltransferase [Spirochaetota bacterium]